MDLRRIKTHLEIGRMRLHRKAKELHQTVHSNIKGAMPKSGEEIGKHIEHKLSASQKIWSNVSAALFSQTSLENISHFSGILLGVVMLLLVDIILIFPTDKKSLAAGVMVTNFFVVLAGLVVINLITYGAMRLLGSKTEFKVYFSTVNTALFMSLLCISIPLALVSFALFSTMLKSDSAINMFFSIIPFYNYLVYGWASETLARLKGIKSILVALIALLVILFFNLLLPQIVV
jgi:hypothetical protein